MRRPRPSFQPLIAAFLILASAGCGGSSSGHGPGGGEIRLVTAKPISSPGTVPPEGAAGYLGKKPVGLSYSGTRGSRTITASSTSGTVASFDASGFADAVPVGPVGQAVLATYDGGVVILKSGAAPEAFPGGAVADFSTYGAIVRKADGSFCALTLNGTVEAFDLPPGAVRPNVCGNFAAYVSGGRGFVLSLGSGSPVELDLPTDGVSGAAFEWVAASADGSSTASVRATVDESFVEKSFLDRWSAPGRKLGLFTLNVIDNIRFLAAAPNGSVAINLSGGGEDTMWESSGYWTGIGSDPAVTEAGVVKTAALAADGGGAIGLTADGKAVAIGFIRNP